VTKSKDNKRRKAELLGMPVGTAERQLRKTVIHELARQLGKNMCRWCGLEISDPDELALIHVEDWEESPVRYFDLGNVALSHASCAAARGGRRQGEVSEMRIEVSVEDAQGNRLPGARHEGELYVSGNRDGKYQVRLKNRTGKRVLVVTTVDGRNVQTGEPGDHHGGGHVLEPYQSWVHKGWRTSDDQVAAFRLGSKGDAYSSQLGSKENVGVIGVAVFEEKEPQPSIFTIKETRYVPYVVERPAPWWPNPHITWTSNTVHMKPGVGPVGIFGTTSSTYDSSQIDTVLCSNTVSSSSAELSSSPRARGNDGSKTRRKKGQVRQELGTEFGEQLSSSVRHTNFVRSTDEPCEIHAIRYDSAEALRRRGINVDRPSRRQEGTPSPFPQNEGYCQPPPRQHRAYKG